MLDSGRRSVNFMNNYQGHCGNYLISWCQIQRPPFQDRIILYSYKKRQFFDPFTCTFILKVFLHIYQKDEKFYIGATSIQNKHIRRPTFSHFSIFFSQSWKEIPLICEICDIHRRILSSFNKSMDLLFKL